jgi:aminoglycoside 6-adenylyltransferase
MAVLGADDTMGQEVAPRTYESIEQRFVVWAWTRDDIRAGVVVGTRARADQPLDEWTDVDIVVLANDPEQYLSSTDWLAEVGSPWFSFVAPTEVGDGLQRRVIFDGALVVDFILVPTTIVDDIEQYGMPAEIAAVLRRGVRILFDKDGVANRLQAPLARAAQPPFLPAMEEVADLVADFWYTVISAVRKLRRGEVLAAKMACDGDIKQLLLTMIEWHARAGSDLSRDTWRDGRSFEESADPRAIDALRDAFARYDARDVEDALRKTLALFRWVTAETAERLGYPYPAEVESNVSRWIDDALER